MVFDLAAIGGVLGGLGQLAGGAAGLFGGGSGSRPDNSSFYQNWRNDDMAFAREQFNYQKQLNESGIRMRVADAKAAGLHPLAAIGQSATPLSPISVGSHNVDFGSGGRTPDIGSSLSNMGQGVGRAMAATATKEERVLTAYELARQAQELQRGDLINQKLAFDLSQMVSSAAAGPGLPSTITGGAAPGVSPESQVLETTSGGVITHPSKQSKAEDEFGAPLMAEFLARNRLGSALGGSPPPAVTSAIKKKYPGATGAYFDVLRFEWRPTYHPSGKGMVHRYIDRRNSYNPRSSAPQGGVSDNYFAP